MIDARYSALMRDDNLPLTAEEIAAGWHFCAEWDGLLIGPGMFEYEQCCPHRACTNGSGGCFTAGACLMDCQSMPTARCQTDRETGQMVVKAVGESVTLRLDHNRSVTAWRHDQGGYMFELCTGGKVTPIALSKEAFMAMIDTAARVDLQ